MPHTRNIGPSRSFSESQPAVGARNNARRPRPPPRRNGDEEFWRRGAAGRGNRKRARARVDRRRRCGTLNSEFRSTPPTIPHPIVPSRPSPSERTPFPTLEHLTGLPQYPSQIPWPSINCHHPMTSRFAKTESDPEISTPPIPLANSQFVGGRYNLHGFANSTHIIVRHVLQKNSHDLKR